jgi:hypothetical protein
MMSFANDLINKSSFLKDMCQIFCKWPNWKLSFFKGPMSKFSQMT